MNITIVFVLVCWLAIMVKGIWSLAKDGSLTTADKAWWVMLFLLFNIVAVILYLLTRKKDYKKPGTYSDSGQQ